MEQRLPPTNLFPTVPEMSPFFWPGNCVLLTSDQSGSILVSSYGCHFPSLKTGGKNLVFTHACGPAIAVRIYPQTYSAFAVHALQQCLPILNYPFDSGLRLMPGACTYVLPPCYRTLVSWIRFFRGACCSVCKHVEYLYLNVILWWLVQFCQSFLSMKLYLIPFSPDYHYAYCGLWRGCMMYTQGITV